MSEFRRPGLVPLQYKYNHSPFSYNFLGNKVVDTAQVTTTSTSRVTLKTYTAPSGALAYARIRIYGHSSSATYAFNVFLNINGTDVWSGSTVSQTKVLLVDAFYSVGAGQTIKVDGYVSSSGVTGYIDEVDIIYGGALLSSTTEVTIHSTTLTWTESGVDNQYIFAGDKYITCGIIYNRKTTATATLKFDGNSTSPAAADDTTNTQFARIEGTHPPNSNNVSVALTGYVGASGDYILIVAVTMTVRHQLKHLDPWNATWYENVFIVYPNALFYILAIKYSFLTLNGIGQPLLIYGLMSDGSTYYNYWSVSSANVSGTTPDYNVVETATDIILDESDTVSIITKLEISIAVAK